MCGDVRLTGGIAVWQRRQRKEDGDPGLEDAKMRRARRHGQSASPYICPSVPVSSVPVSQCPSDECIVYSEYGVCIGVRMAWVGGYRGSGNKAKNELRHCRKGCTETRRRRAKEMQKQKQEYGSTPLHPPHRWPYPHRLRLLPPPKRTRALSTVSEP